MSHWIEKSNIYHIYPLGFCGCERFRSEAKDLDHGRILKVIEWIPHLKNLNMNAVYFGPVFESFEHGYDTTDYYTIDKRLGTNEEFGRVCEELHKNGIRVILDGVFNHVGREFGKFIEVRNGNHQYRDWFHINDGNSCYNDGFYYEGWEGHYELVKLNLYNPAVKDYIKECITGWVNQFGIDGIRLDVAYCLDLNFLKELHGHCKWLRDDFWLMGETLHGDYNKWMNPEMLDSVTNYECYKGLFSSFNELNMYEISYSLNRQFGSENWCIYRGKLLYSFVDNHDVSRVATILKNKKHIPLIYSLLFTMPGIPGVYYGSEFGIEGDKSHGDDALRTMFDLDKFKAEGICDVTELLTKLCKLRNESKALAYGSFANLQLTNRQYSFRRDADGETIVTLLNADENLSAGDIYFVDVEASSIYYKDIAFMKANGIMNGIDSDRFAPLRTITYEEALSVIDKIIDRKLFV